MKTLLFFFVASAISLPSFAIVRLSRNQHCAFSLQGPIELGNAEQLDELVIQHSDRSPKSICMNSGGGNFEEGLRLAHVLLRRQISTVVLEGGQCYSACAVAFMFGTNSDWKPSRRVAVGGALGFHAPFIKSTEEGTRQEFYRQGVVAIRKFLEIQHNSETYFSTELMRRMLTTEPQDLLIMKTLNDLGTYNIAPLIDLTAILNGSAESRRIQMLQACKNAEAWKLRKTNATMLDDTNKKALKTQTTKADYSGTTFRNTAFAEYAATDLELVPPIPGSNFAIGMDYNPSHCLIQERLEPSYKIGVAPKTTAMRLTFESASLFSPKWFGRSGSWSGIDERWYALDPTTVICEGSCLTIRGELLR